MAEVDFTNYDFTLGEPIIVVANTPCGISDPFNLNVSTIPLPVPDFTITSPVCEGGLAEANFVGDQSTVMEYIWSTDNYNSGNQSGPGPVSYSSATAGTYTVSLVIIDEEGCQSEPVERTFDVVSPLAAPVIDCSSTASSVSFSWDPIAGATGYIINVLQSPTPQGPFTNTETETSIEFTGLNVNDVVEIEVIAIGQRHVIMDRHQA